MIPVSAAFNEAVRNSHASVARVRLITPGLTGGELPGRDLAIIQGEVTLDATADVRGAVDITVLEPWPEGNSLSDLVPYGTEITVARGIEIGNGAQEFAGLGIYRLTIVEQPDIIGGPLRLVGEDRMSGIRESRLVEPVSFASVQTVEETVEILINGGTTTQGQSVSQPLPYEVEIEWDEDETPSQTLDRTIIAEDERYRAFADLISSLGKVAYFDYRGILVILDRPDPTVPVWQADAGAGGVLVSGARSLTREGVYSVAVATGEALDDVSPVHAVAEDDDPSSPTFTGTFGVVPVFFSSPFITTESQAQNAAENLLERNRGLPYNVDFSQIPNPALEPYDPVEIVYPIELGLSPAIRREIHVLEQVVIGLAPDQEMRCSTKLSSREV